MPHYEPTGDDEAVAQDLAAVPSVATGTSAAAISQNTA